MKKVLFLASFFCAVFLLVDSQLKFTGILAQTERDADKSNGVSILSQQDETDRQLASTIRRLTNRSTAGLSEERTPDGKYKVDLQERFQNVMLSRVDEAGEPAAACVTSLGEANAFFGKNLETGESVPSTKFEKDDLASLAARHGMSENEFEFYQNLIEIARFTRTRRLSPLSTVTLWARDLTTRRQKPQKGEIMARRLANSD